MRTTTLCRGNSNGNTLKSFYPRSLCPLPNCSTTHCNFGSRLMPCSVMSCVRCALPGGWRKALSCEPNAYTHHCSFEPSAHAASAPDAFACATHVLQLSQPPLIAPCPNKVRRVRAWPSNGKCVANSCRCTANTFTGRASQAIPLGARVQTCISWSSEAQAAAGARGQF